MRVDRITLKGVTRFRDAITVDLSNIGPGLVAIAGRNGEGKTTILEAPFAALHLEFPSRPGPLHHVCNGKDARLELELGDGGRYRALVAVDAVLKTPKTEAYLFNGDGSPLVSGKVREYQERIRELFGSPRLMLSAALSAQTKRGSFLELSKAERKDLLAEILDTAGLQALSEAARAHAKQCEERVLFLRARREALREELNRLEGASPERLAELEGQRDTLERRLEAAEEQLHAAEVVRLEAQDRLASIERLDRTLKDLLARIDDVRAEQQRQRDAITLVREQLEQVESRCAATIRESAVEAGRLEEYEADLARLEQAMSEVRSLRERERRTAEELAKAEAQIRELQAERRGLEQRIETAARRVRLLGEVPCRGADEYAACPLLKDAISARDSIDRMRSQVDGLEDQLRTLQEGCEKAREDLAIIREELRASEGRESEFRQAAARLEAARGARDRLKRAEEELGRERERCTAAVRRAEARLGELEREELELVEQAGAIQAELEETDLDEIRHRLQEAERAGRDAAERRREALRRLETVRSEIAVLGERIARREEIVETLQEIGGELDARLADATEWRLLERALGRDGIQALEIDAAGPELSALTNDLLHGCFGERFDVRFITQVPRRSGDGFKEVFDVQIVDHDRGREGTVDSLSGGEKTIISEAISLALAIYVARHSGRRFETLFRDETAGALDPDNAHRYVQMLRRAREISGAHQIVFIAQQPEVWQQADAVIHLRDGKVEVAS